MPSLPAPDICPWESRGICWNWCEPWCRIPHKNMSAMSTQCRTNRYDTFGFSKPDFESNLTLYNITIRDTTKNQESFSFWENVIILDKPPTDRRRVVAWRTKSSAPELPPEEDDHFENSVIRSAISEGTVSFSSNDVWSTAVDISMCLHSFGASRRYIHR